MKLGGVLCKLLCIYKLWYLARQSGGWGEGGVAAARLGRFDRTTFCCILITSRGQKAFDIILPIIYRFNRENTTMAKKTTTIPATVSPLSVAIAADIAANLGADKSATEVSGAFDKQFPFPWALFKGNASAAKCGMSATEFKLVRDTRTEYRDAWKEAGLKNFDGRWQYVTSLSVHAPKVEDKPTAAKTTEAKLEEA